MNKHKITATNNQFTKRCLFFLFLFLFFSRSVYTQNSQPLSGDTENTTKDELAVKEVIEQFLKAAGNYDVITLRSLFLPNANIGGYSFKEGQWNSFSFTAETWFERLSQTVNPKLYTEPVSNYTIHMSEGRLAFVKADAILHRDGQPRSHNMDFFVLMNAQGEWKFLSGSYTSVPIK
jgi:hypothetical protein